MHRRHFVKQAFTLSATGYFGSQLLSCTSTKTGKIITVNGPIDPSVMGMTLAHEHVMVDFIGADQTNANRYNVQEVYETVLPYMQSIAKAGCKTFIDCTPAWLGRDVLILQKLSAVTGIHIVTNTGFYGAAEEKFLPSLIKSKSAEEIAGIWIKEAKHGIDNTTIKPGFMKLGLDGLPFSDPIQKILKAAAITYKETALTIGVHTGKGGEPAVKELELLEALGVPPQKWIWIHSQNENSNAYHISLARKGAWISLDSISSANANEYIERLKIFKQEKLLHKILVSQDAGWYNIGEEGGGKFRTYTDFFTHFLPALKTSGFSEDEIHQLTVTNPAIAFQVI